MCVVVPSEVVGEMLFSVMFLPGRFAIQTFKKNFFDIIFASVTHLRNHITTQEGNGSHPNRFENSKNLLHNEPPLLLEFLPLF